MTFLLLNVKQEAVNINFYSVWFENQTRVSRFSSKRFVFSTIDRFQVEMNYEYLFTRRMKLTDALFVAFFEMVDVGAV